MLRILDIRMKNTPLIDWVRCEVAYKKWHCSREPVHSSIMEYLFSRVICLLELAENKAAD